MKNIPIISFLILMALASATVVFGVSRIPSSATADTCANHRPGATYHIEIKNDKLSFPYTRGRLCDQIIITNTDHKSRELAFGEHNQHKAYDGVGEKVLTQGQSITVTLNKTGTYMYHDHFQDSVKGFFTVVN